MGGTLAGVLWRVRNLRRVRDLSRGRRGRAGLLQQGGDVAPGRRLTPGPLQRLRLPPLLLDEPAQLLRREAVQPFLDLGKGHMAIRELRDHLETQLMFLSVTDAAAPRARRREKTLRDIEVDRAWAYLKARRQLVDGQPGVIRLHGL